MKNPEIGKIYTFNYDSLHESIKKDYSTMLKCSLNKKETNNLVETLGKESKKIEEYHERHKESLYSYFRILKALENEKSRRKEIKAKRKTRKEKELELMFTEEKKKFFPKQKSNKSKKQIAYNTFIRNFIPERIKLSNDGIKAVYAGKYITSKNNINHKWFILSPINIDVAIANNIEKYINIEV